jgi:hypothetical protein
LDIFLMIPLAVNSFTSGCRGTCVNS